ncbi:MAG: hypothetical protein LBS76_03210 [Mycoplasmataceae bacterium]|nr:hypothetical protein [Mycoplasmataceae bacterium]
MTGVDGGIWDVEANETPTPDNSWYSFVWSNFTAADNGKDCRITLVSGTSKELPAKIEPLILHVSGIPA